MSAFLMLSHYTGWCQKNVVVNNMAKSCYAVKPPARSCICDH